MTGRTARRRVLRVQAGNGAAAPEANPRADLLAVEEPLEIRLNGSPLTVTMRTPATTSTSRPGSWPPRVW